MQRLVLYPNAKINLGLYVTRKRLDGFHDIETIFLPLPELCDTIEVEMGIVQKEPFLLEIVGNDVLASETDNLLCKVWRLLAPYGLPTLRVSLKKKIPTGAGLGGGSADASFFLRAMLPFCAQPPAQDLQVMALSLGSDCPFFLLNMPAIGRGRGELLTPITINKLAGYWVLVLIPKVEISTREAFASIVPEKPTFSMEERLELPLSEWNEQLKNVFQPGIVAKYNEIQQALDFLKRKGAFYYSLSGTGAAVFGLFCKEVFCEGEVPTNWFVHKALLSDSGV